MSNDPAAEKDYRKHLNGAYERVAKAFDAVDPDLAEVELGLVPAW